VPRGIQPEDLDPDQGPVIVHTDVPEDSYVDAVTGDGLRSLRLPDSYPRDASGRTVPHETCQPIGARSWDSGEPGIACRSAALGAPASGEELAFFARTALVASRTERFLDWYW
jgi:hypothetical protein